VEESAALGVGVALGILGVGAGQLDFAGYLTDPLLITPALFLKLGPCFLDLGAEFSQAAAFLLQMGGQLGFLLLHGQAPLVQAGFFLKQSGLLGRNRRRLDAQSFLFPP
jgi:hypothetical protein